MDSNAGRPRPNFTTNGRNGVSNWAEVRMSEHLGLNREPRKNGTSTRTIPRLPERIPPRKATAGPQAKFPCVQQPVSRSHKALSEPLPGIPQSPADRNRMMTVPNRKIP